ncbi:MAG TPA: hypothetical protein VGC59_02855 [Solirubrobacteraceae bacterium]
MLRSIALVAVALVAVAVATSLHGTAPAEGSCLPPLLPCRPESGPPPVASDPPAHEDPAPEPPLAIGLTESDPRLLVARGITRGVAARAIALRPRYIRVLVPWERVQPSALQRPNWDAPPGGCPRSQPRCASERGLRGLLHAIKLRQETDGGWRILIVPYFTPPWAGHANTGCQRPHATSLSRMPRIGAYRRFLRGIQGLADGVGVQIAYLSPWNEPNHPAFLSPQRRTCSVSSPPLAPAAYAKLVRAAVRELRPDQQLVLGSLAGIDPPRLFAAGAAEFIRALPQDVACLDGPFAQHKYIGRRARHGTAPLRADPATAAAHTLIDDVDAALGAHGCAKPKPLWIAETGTFDHRCEAVAAALGDWARDPRVTAAFQYTFRESQAFPVGLVSPSMRTTYASYRAWHAFARASEIPAAPCG